jgi:hypothetical protein
MRRDDDAGTVDVSARPSPRPVAALFSQSVGQYLVFGEKAMYASVTSVMTYLH